MSKEFRLSDLPQRSQERLEQEAQAWGRAEPSDPFAAARARAHQKAGICHVGRIEPFETTEVPHRFKGMNGEEVNTKRLVQHKRP